MSDSLDFRTRLLIRSKYFLPSSYCFNSNKLAPIFKPATIKSELFLIFFVCLKASLN